MTHDYINMTPEQLSTMEREAYNAGDTDRAALYPYSAPCAKKHQLSTAGE